MNIEKRCQKILKENREDSERLCSCKNMGSVTFDYLINAMLAKSINFVDKIKNKKYRPLINNLEDQTLKLAEKVENHYVNLENKGK